jgi:FG-GAP repeat protein
MIRPMNDDPAARRKLGAQRMCDNNALPAPRPSGSSRVAKTVASVLACGALVVAAQPASAQFRQEGSKLVGTSAIGNADQGFSVALSSNGNTLIVGGPYDNSYTGAAWVWTRNGGVWNQQTKLFGNDSVLTSDQGWSVAISADGTTAIVGGPLDDYFPPYFGPIGAAWVYTLSGGVWTQQGSKLVAYDYSGAPQQGGSVAVSADGNTMIMGGYEDDSSFGAAWVFSRSNGVWSEQQKLVAYNYLGCDPEEGASVALSADGNTAIVGGALDNCGVGAAWVWTRSNGVWTQQAKLVGTGYSSSEPRQGWSVALSGDGNTAIVGGPTDESPGAAWVFTRSGTTWSQQGNKLVGTGAAAGSSFQGGSVALSGDGNIAMVGGSIDVDSSELIGAAWVFTRTGGVWRQQSKLVGTGNVGNSGQGTSVALSTDSSTAAVGGPTDNYTSSLQTGVGAAWVFVQPALIFTAAPIAGKAPLAVTFRAGRLIHPMTYTINFGDGTTGPVTQDGCTSIPPIVGQGGLQCFGSASHTYHTAAQYTATLLDASGLTLGTATISVGDFSPVPVGGGPPLPGGGVLPFPLAHR